MSRTLVGAAVALAGFTPLAAQVREGTRTSLDEARIAFGYVCEDRFVVTNEGSEPVRLEYGLERSDSRTALNLDGRESVELLLSTDDRLELMMEGRVIASAHNERRRCEDDRDPPRVVVRRPVVSVEPVIVVVRSPPYYRYYDSGWWHHHHHHPRAVVHATIRIPIVIGRSSRDRDHGRDRDYGRGRSNDRGRDRDRARRSR